MIRRLTLAVLLMLVAVFSTASAHYLWVSVEKKGKQEVIQLVFEEGPRRGDGFYLDPFVKRGQTWVQTMESPKAVPVKLTEEKTAKPKRRWLTTKLPVKQPYSVTSYGKWGVYKYPRNTFVLLHYHAQYLDVANAKQMESLGRSDHLKMDMQPKIMGNKLQLQVFWKGKPAANRPFYIRSRKMAKNVKTDAKGIVTVPLDSSIRQMFRTYMEFDEAGTFEGKAYTKIRYHYSLTMTPPSS